MSINSHFFADNTKNTESSMSKRKGVVEETYGKDVVAATKGSTEAKTLTEQSMTIAWALTSKTASAVYSASSFTFSKAKEADENLTLRARLYRQLEPLLQRR